jgi:hypothetical protein
MINIIPILADSHFIKEIPLLGAVDLSTYSLPVLTVVIGFLDGFNPCAMWVLLFLISLLLDMKDNLKRWILGIAFILTTGVIYFLFLGAWLELALYVGYTPIVRTLIGGVAIFAGFWNARKFFKKDEGCEIIDQKKRKNVFGRLKKITSSKSFILSLVGIILLAISVNLVELACSAGFPAIYAELLSLSDLTRFQYYGYLLLYVLIFMIDDLLVFGIAMTTLRATGVSKKYSKWSSLVGGIIIFAVGIILIFKPELLMFG